MIKSIAIKDFKSIKETNIKVPQFCAIVGRNASGKTNFIQAINYVKELSLGKTTDIVQDSISFIPEELFNYDEGASNFSICVDIEAEVKNSYSLTIEIQKMDMENKPSRLDITYEKLEKNGLVVYERQKNNLWDASKNNIPLLVDPNKLALALYNNPDTSSVKKELSNYIIAWPDLTKFRDSIGVVGSSEQSLANILVKLRHEDPTAYVKFTEIAKKIMPSFSSLTEVSGPPVAKTNGSSDDRQYYIILFEELNLREKLSMKSISEGDFRTLFLIANAIRIRPFSAFVIEEIENGMHPSRVTELISHLRIISIKQDIQVIFTTHSPIVINDMIPSEIIYVEKIQDGGTKISLLEDSNQLSAIKKVLEKGGKLTDILGQM